MAKPATTIVPAMLQSHIQANCELTLLGPWRLSPLGWIELQIAISGSWIEMTFDYNVMLAGRDE